MIATPAVAVELVSPQRRWRVGGFPRLGDLLTLCGPVGVVQNVLHDPQLVRPPRAKCCEPITHQSSQDYLAVLLRA